MFKEDILLVSTTITMQCQSSSTGMYIFRQNYPFQKASNFFRQNFFQASKKREHLKREKPPINPNTVSFLLFVFLIAKKPNSVIKQFKLKCDSGNLEFYRSVT